MNGYANIRDATHRATDVACKFEKIKAAKRETSVVNPDKELIDLGVGQPDRMANLAIVDALAKEATKWENRDYADNGIPEFERAATTYMKWVFGVKSLKPKCFT